MLGRAFLFAGRYCPLFLAHLTASIPLAAIPNRPASLLPYRSLFRSRVQGVECLPFSPSLSGLCNALCFHANPACQHRNTYEKKTPPN